MEISSEISKAFNNKEKKMLIKSDPVNKYNVLVKQFVNKVEKREKTINASNYEWNIFVKKKPQVEDPLYNRSIFISSILNTSELSKILPNNTQSIGLFVEKFEKNKIVRDLSYNGVDRFPEIGSMSLYTNPWDGYLPMQNMIRWVTY